MKLIKETVKDPEQFILCDNCPCLAFNDSGEDCQLDYHTHAIKLKNRGRSHVSQNCELEHIKHKSGEFKPETITDSEIVPEYEYSEAEKIIASIKNFL